jgi:hypothetical protein
LIQHYTLIGRDFEEVMRGRNETLDVYPNRPAPVVVEQDGQRVVRQDMLWGFPPFRQGAGYGTNFRSLKNHLWRGWLDREHRCVVPATAFAEPDRNTSKPVQWRWFERADKQPFFFFAGFASGFLSLVPYLGIVLALLPPVFLGLGQISVAAMGWIALTSLTLHIVAMNVLYPKLLGKRLSLNPLALTIALLIWAWLWGAAGLLLAVPITAGMKIVFDHVESLKPFGAWLGEEDGGNGNGNGTGNSPR